MKIVISLGGTLISPAYDKIDVDFLKKFTEILLSYDNDYIIICGGGYTSRLYTETCKKEKIEKKIIDTIGVNITLMHAMFLSQLFKGMAEYIYGSPVHILSKFSNKRIIITGGYLTGTNTDVDSANIASEMNAELLINLTTMHHIHDKNPEEYSDAVPIQSMTWNQLMEIIKKNKNSVNYRPFHLKAVEICSHKGIKMAYLRGLENLKKVLEGERFSGTLVF